MLLPRLARVALCVTAAAIFCGCGHRSAASSYAALPVPASSTTSTIMSTTSTSATSLLRASRSRPGPYRLNWPALVVCESGGHNDNTGNGFYGYFQFDRRTFEAITGLAGVASDYPYSVQLDAAERLFAERGRQPWPVCGHLL